MEVKQRWISKAIPLLLHTVHPHPHTHSPLCTHPNPSHPLSSPSPSMPFPFMHTPLPCLPHTSPPQVCERLLRALMEWARTRDTRYLLAAQQDIIAVQNGEGDT